jgi:GNAT superfamily N-acetyltransferase
MDLIFREALPSDCGSFSVLMDELSERAYSQDLLKEQLRNSYDDPAMYVMVAENCETHELVGSMLGLLCKDFCGKCRPILFIENVVTSSKFRRKGVARGMFTAMEKWGREHDVNYAVLCSAMYRKEAHMFYNNIGYEEVKGYKKYL